jgi:hypothetical protein
MLSKIRQEIISEYTKLGIISPCQVKKIQSEHELSHSQTEELIGDLLEHGVCILENHEVEYVRAVQASVFYEDRQRCNALLNTMFLDRLMATIFVLPYMEGSVDVSVLHRLSDWRQHLRELTRLQMVTAGEEEGRIRLSEGFLHIQRTIHTYLDKGYVEGLEHSWRELAKTDAVSLAKKVCQSPFFSSVVLPTIRECYLSLPEMRKLVAWITDCQDQPASLLDVVKYAVDRDELREVWWLLLGDTPSSSQTVIENGSDVCFECLKIENCTPRFAGRYDSKSIGNLLRQYQTEIAAEFLEEVSSGDGSIERLMPILAEDMMLLKFTVERRVVQRAKALLKSLDILDKRCAVLDKRSGMYCPLNDLWLVNSEIC